MTKEYCEAATEVLAILDHCEEKAVKLIPEKFISYLRENAEKDYKVDIDYSKPIEKMNIKDETKGILGSIFHNWWWSEEQKQEYERLVKENEEKHLEELNKTYNVFKRKETNTIETIQKSSDEVESVSMVEYKESFFTRFINKIKSFFKIK